MNEQNCIRSRSSGDPKTSPGAVAVFTANAGPAGARLKKKYMQGSAVKGVGNKTGGNSGGVGRAARRKQRMHGGGQITTEERDRRKAQSDDAVRARNSW